MSFKTKEMCEDAVYEEPSTLQYVPDKYKTKRCVMMLYMMNHLHYNMFLIS